MNRKSVNLLVLMAIITLVIVHALFSVVAPFPWMQAVWDAGDLITYIGTLVLGIVAFTQNARANEMNRRLILLEENRYRLEARPFVFVSDWNVKFLQGWSLLLSGSEAKETVFVDVGGDLDTPDKKIMTIEFLLTNTTQACLSAQYNGVKFVDSDEDTGWRQGYIGPENLKLVLSPGQVGKITFCGTQELFENTFQRGKIRMSFILENRFGERYQEDFDAAVTLLTSQSESDKPWLLIDASNYRIGKFECGSGKPELKWEEDRHPGRR